MNAKLAGLKVIASGSLVSSGNDSIEIFPFEDDFGIKLQFRFSNEGPPTVEVDDDDDDERSVVVVFKRPFSTGEHFSNVKPLVLAQSDDGKSDYLGKFAINIIGVESRYTTVVNYTILEKAI